MNVEMVFFYYCIAMSLVLTPFVYVLLKLLMDRDGKNEYNKTDRREAETLASLFQSSLG